MSNTEKFCLRWNDFETNISVAFRELREEKDFFDVTLACDDSQIQAHKVILSACSPFFRNVLRRNPHQHPLLYLKGVKYKELLSVLNFMYMGEVNVAQEELNSFLSVAEDLRVKGLTQNNSSEAQTPRAQPKQEGPPKHIPRPRDPPERDPVPPPKRPRPPPPAPQIQDPIQSYHQDDDIQEVVPVKSEPRDPAPMPMTAAPVEQQMYHQTQAQGLVEEHQQGTVALEDSYADESYDYGQYEEGYDDGSGMAMGGGIGTDANKDEVIRSKMFKNPSGGWQCTDCDHTSQHTTNMKNHIEVKHVGSSGYYCQQCNKFCSTKNALNNHRTRYRH